MTDHKPLTLHVTARWWVTPILRAMGVASRLGIPERWLRRVIRPLMRHGLVCRPNPSP